MSLIGRELMELDTPVLWVDLDRMEANIRRFAEYFRQAGVAWRPHTKGIKIPAIAHRLVSAGAVGITCSKLSEAEVMAASGIADIMIANQVVGSPKATRLASLQRQARVSAAVDDLGSAEELSRAALSLGVQIPVLVEVDTGMKRCGIQPGSGAVDFIRTVAALPGLTLDGLMAWEGHVVRLQDPEEKQRVTREAVCGLVETAELCRQAGIEIRVVSCGGTGSYPITAHIPGVTEIQAGGGIFGGIIYRQWGAGMQDAMFILATVTSHAAPGWAVVDAGRKAMNMEYTPPEPVDLPGTKLSRFSAEHAVLELSPETPPVKVGDKLNLVVGYEDLTVFLHDQVYGIRSGKVEVVWEVLGRGKLT